MIRWLLNHSLIDEQYVTYQIVYKSFAIYAFYGRYADRAFYEVPSKREFV